MGKEAWQSVTQIIWNYFKMSDSACRTVRKMWVQCCHLDDGTLLAPLSIRTCFQTPGLFLYNDCHAFTLVLPLACRCQQAISTRMDIPSITANYPLCRLWHSQVVICKVAQDRWFSWTLKFLWLIITAPSAIHNCPSQEDGKITTYDAIIQINIAHPYTYKNTLFYLHKIWT